MGSADLLLDALLELELLGLGVEAAAACEPELEPAACEPELEPAEAGDDDDDDGATL